MEPYVFVSYSRKQFYVAEQLATELRGLGLSVWLDVQEIDPGVDWQTAIMCGIEGCRALVLVASRASYQSKPVQEEVAAARAAGKPIYLAVVDDTPFLKELKGRATAIDCRSAFSAQMRVLAQAIRTDDRRHHLLPNRRSFIPRLPFGLTKYMQLLALNLFFAFGTIAIVLREQVAVGKITPQILPLVLMVGVPVGLWFLSFAYSFFLLWAFRYQRFVTYTVLDVWPVLGLFIPPALLFFIVSFDTFILGISINLGFSVDIRLANDPASLTLAVVLIIALLLTYGAMVFCSLRNVALVFAAALPFGVLVGLPIPTIIRYPLLLLLGGIILYASLRASITGAGLRDAMGEIGWTTINGPASSPESRAWARWLTPGAFASDVFAPAMRRLRERPAPTPFTDTKTWHLYYISADSGCAEDIRRVFASYPSLEETVQTSADYHIVVLSSRTPRKWLDALTTTYGQIICVAVSAIDLAALAQPLHQNQWVDFRQQRPEQLAYLARALAGDDQYVNPTTPESLARPLGPYPVALVSHALRAGGLIAVVLGAAALLVMHTSDIVLTSIPLAALSILIGVGAFWEAQRLRVRDTSIAALIVIAALIGLDLAYWLIGAAIVPLAPRAILTHNGTYNQYLTAGFQMVAYFVGAPIGLLFLVGWVEFFRQFPTLVRWLPRPAGPSWHRRLIPPLWKRLEVATVAYGLAALLITSLLVVDSPYQFPRVHEYDVNVAAMSPEDLVYGSDGKIWFSVSGDNAGYGLGYILPDGTMKPVQVLTPQPADCVFSPYSGSAHDIFYDCYEGNDLQLGPDHDFWYTTDMLYQPNNMQIVRATAAGATTVFPLPTHSKLGTHIHFTFDAAGNLWFTQAIPLSLSDSAGVIGRIDTTGHLTEFPAMDNSQPEDIVAGPDGNLWFTDASRGGIGKVTSAGEVTFYPTPVASDASDIMVGGDQHIWFAAPKLGVIGRIAADGVAQLFVQPPGSMPENLVWGPDGALWFLDAGLDAVGRMALDGTSTRYPLPAPIAVRSPLIVGSDGNLWCALDHQIARITSSGTVTQYALPTLDAIVTGMVSAPDHRIWFVESTGLSGLIGVISP